MASLGKAGSKQGDMAPKIMDYQKPSSAYSQSGFSQVDNYIGRKDRQEKAESSGIKSQAYKGRYS